jgi:hypothetical protein
MRKEHGASQADLTMGRMNVNTGIKGKKANLLCPFLHSKIKYLRQKPGGDISILPYHLFDSLILALPFLLLCR